MATIINNPDTGVRDSGGLGVVLAVVIIALLVIAFFVFGFRGRTVNTGVSNNPAPTTNNSGNNAGVSTGGSSGQGTISGQGSINYSK